MTPERIYERRWTLDVINRAITRLAAKYTASGRHALFVRLTPYLTGDEPQSYAALAASTGSSENALRQAVHRLRKEFRATLRETIAETVESGDDVDDELRYLLRVIAREP